MENNTSKLYNVSFTNTVHKVENVICAAPTPEAARSYCSEILGELGHADWVFKTSTPIRLGIFPGDAGKLITMNETAATSAR
jgi:hypothetical protein